MNRDEMRELAAMYALGGLDGLDRERFEALLRADDPEATAALREFESTLVGLSVDGAETPPAGVKAALMERIAASEPTRARVTPLKPRRSLWPALWAAALAAGLAAIVVGLSISASYQKRLETLGQETARLRAELARQQQILALVRDPSTVVMSLSGLDPAPGARARMLWNPPAGGLLVAAGLPAAPPGKTYELWAIAGKNPPVPAGLFVVDDKGTGSLRVAPLSGVDKVDVFAVTLEPAGGVPAPTGPMYLAGKT